jgi:Neocarzinostatin family
MRGWLRAGVALAGAVAIAALALPLAAGASGLVVKVTPNQGLKPGQTVTVSGHGLPKSPKGSPRTWFVTECTAAVRGRMNPATDTPHCDISNAQALRVSASGWFSSKYHLVTGIIGDGYCGTDGHSTCVIGVGDAQGQGTVVRITFKVPAPAPTTTTTAG